MRSSWIAVPVLASVLLLSTSPTAVAKPEPAIRPARMQVRGWLMSTADPAYVGRVLAAARRYGVNHLDLSHGAVMNADDIVRDPRRAERIEAAAARAKRQGIKPYIWAHELNTSARNLDLDPGSPAGRTFWEGRKAAYRSALEACPSVAGVVLMYGSSPTEVWSVETKDAFWRSLSMPARVRYVTEQVRSVVVGEFHKKLIVRDFNHSPSELAWLVEALRDYPDITMYSKSEPQDFQLFYPHSFSIGAYGTTPQILEMDLCGEYWGQSQIPVSLVGHLRYRMRYGVRKGVAGAVGRIDTGRNHALGTPNEINLYAFQRLLADPDTTVQAIYDGWLARRYGLRPGSRAARTLQSILERSFEMAKRTYYTQGFWTWKSQSTMPSTAAQIDGGIVGKSTAWWDPTAKAAERRLVRPDAEIVRAIVSEKADAVALADRNLNEAAGLKGRIAPQDFADLHQRLARAASVARLYQAIASAYWRVKLRALHPDAPEASARAAERAIEELAAWAPKLESARGDFGGLAAQAPRLRSFVADLRARLATQ